MLGSRRRGHARALASTLALAASAGCGIGNSFSDDCQGPRLGYEAAQRMLGGLRQRGVAAPHARYRQAEEALRRAQLDLSTCLVADGAG